MLSECVDGFGVACAPLGGGMRRRQLLAVCGGSLFLLLLLLLLLLHIFGFFLVECLTYDFGFA